MALDSDDLVDRRRLKRHLTLWRSLAIVAVVGLAIVGVGRATGLPKGAHIAQLWVGGLIVDAENRREALRRLKTDRSAKALIVRIDSPGGTVVGGESLYQALREVAATKPVVAVMGQVATSAGYMVALAADRIVAREGTITGSIGVILQTAEVTELLSKLGIRAEAIKSGPLKAVPSPLEPMSPEARAATQGLVNDIFEMFVSLVAERRAMPRDKVLALADGRVFSGRPALAGGLIDQIGGPRDAISWLAKEKRIDPDLPVRDLEIDDEVIGWLGRLDSLARKTLFSERLTLDGLVSLWHPGRP